MARIACLYSIEKYNTVNRPLHAWDMVPFGLSIVAACLERAGHNVRFWVATPHTNLDQMIREIVHDFGCDMVAASAITTQFPAIASVCRTIKISSPSTPILVGGVHPSIQPQECIEHPAIDAICVGEGEDVAVAWAKALAIGTQPRGIPGAWIKVRGSNEIDRTPPAPFRTDLDQLPFVNRALWERWVDPQDRSLNVVVGRGCPYACTYCSNHAIRRVQPGRYVRFRSPSNIVTEIGLVLERFPDLTSLYLETETIGASIPWALELCDHLAKFNAKLERPLNFTANFAVTSHFVRNEQQLRAFLGALQRANVCNLNVGLESGSPRVRADILNRPEYTNAELARFCQIAREHDIKIALFLLMGVPTETPADAIQTSAVARACDPDAIFPSIFYPYPGTRLHELATELDMIDPQQIGIAAERFRVYVRSKDFPRWRVFYEYALLSLRIFHGRWSNRKIMRAMIGTSLGIIPSLLVMVHRTMECLRVLGRRAAFSKSRLSAP